MVLPGVLPEAPPTWPSCAAGPRRPGPTPCGPSTTSTGPTPSPRPFTTLAVAAATTTRPLLGTCVLQLPLRPPSAVAKQATALQLLSDGRFVLGLGVGIHEGEYVRAGVDYHRRGPAHGRGRRRAPPGLGRPDEAAAPTTCRSRPRRPVPLWFGGASAAARRRAAAVGDGWVPLFLAPDDYGTALAALRRETAEAGRDPEAVQAGVVVFACVGDDDQAPVRGAQWLSELYRLPPKAFQRHLVAGSPETCAAALRPLRRRRRPPHPRHGGRVPRRRALRAAASRVRRRARTRRWRECPA